MGIGDWGLGIWGLGVGGETQTTNPKTPTNTTKNKII